MMQKKTCEYSLCSIRSFREHHECMLRCRNHNAEYIAYCGERDFRMKEITHTVYKNSTRFFPHERQISLVFMHRHAKRIFFRIPASPRQPLRHSLGIAMIAPRRNLRAPRHRVPHLITPVDFCRHFVPPYRILQPVAYHATVFSAAYLSLCRPCSMLVECVN